MNKLLKLEESPEIKNAGRVVDLRNYIIHAYDEVEEEILWGIIVNNLPELRKEVESFLSE